MLKKILSIFSIFAPLSLMNGNVFLADTGSYRFTDDSSIKSDITQLGLDYSDYKLISDKNYNRTDVIALSESYIDSGNSKQIVNYVYVYNPYKMIDDVLSITLKYNDSSIIQKVESSTKDYLTNIVKYKVDFRMPSYSELKRRYDISDLTYSDNSTDKIDFGCTYNQDGSNVQLDYDSYIFITGKELFDYCPFNFTGIEKGYTLASLYSGTPFDSSNDGISSFINNDSSEYINYDINVWKGLFHYNWDFVVPDFVYLNFDTNKKIDVINEIDFSFKILQGKDYDYHGIGDGNDFAKICKSFDSMSLDDSHLTLINEYTSSNPYILYNEKNTFVKGNDVETSYGSVVSMTDLSFNNVEIMARNRLDKWSDSNFYNLMSNDVLSNSSDKLTARQSFENRQVSILIDVLPIYIDSGITNSDIYKYTIRDLSVLRINYITDMKVVNARCNSGALISSVNSNEVPKQGFWDRFIEWFNNNFPYSLLIIGGVIVGLPFIIAIVVSLFTSGSSALLSGIGKGISKLITSLVKGLVKLIVAIISLPFKFLGAILSPKKNNSNKTSKKK